MTRMSPEQEAYLPLVARAWADEARGLATIQERLAEQVRLESAALVQQTDDVLAAAHAAGVPVRRMMQAMGTTHFAAVKARIGAGTARRDGTPEPVSKTLADYLTVQQSPAWDGAWRVTATDVPAALWTYTPQGGDAYDVPPARYSAYLDVDKAGQHLVSTRGHNSDPKGPLHLEWARGDKSIRDILKTMGD